MTLSRFSGLGRRSALTAIALLSSSLVACQSAPPTSQAQEEPSGTASPAAMSHAGHGSQSKGAMEHSMSMDLGPADAEYDLRYIDAMVLHHQGAIDMAQEAKAKSKRAEIQQLADAIIAAQNQEIQQLQEWRKAWYPDAAATPVAYSAEMGHTMAMTPEQAAAMTMSSDLGGAGEEVDLAFIDGMIPHHEGALVMAEDALQKSSRPEIKALSEEIIEAQRQEIEQMQAWRQDWYPSERSAAQAQ